jgi:hypothetical protein
LDNQPALARTGNAGANLNAESPLRVEAALAFADGAANGADHGFFTSAFLHW